MTVFKKLIFRMKSALDCLLSGEVTIISNALTLSTTSTSATWSPTAVINSGDTLTWEISGDITPTSQVINDPTFNLSANTGTVDMVVYNVNGLTEFLVESLNLISLDVTKSVALTILNCRSNQLSTLDVSNNTALTILYCYLNQLTTLDVSNNTALTILNCSSNQLTTLDVSNNTALTELYCYLNQLTTLDISNNPLLKILWCYDNGLAPSVTDKLLIDLDNHGQTNGNLRIGNNRTSASDTARANLITKGWNITDIYTP